MTKIIIHFRDDEPEIEILAVERINFSADWITVTFLDFDRMRPRKIDFETDKIDWIEPKQY